MKKDVILLIMLCPISVFADGIDENADTTVARHFDIDGVEVVGFKQDAHSRDAISETVLSGIFVRQTEMNSIKDLGYMVRGTPYRLSAEE